VEVVAQTLPFSVPTNRRHARGGDASLNDPLSQPEVSVLLNGTVEKSQVEVAVVVVELIRDLDGATPLLLLPSFVKVTVDGITEAAHEHIA